MSTVTEATRDALAEWEVRCKSLGMLMTAPRRAILGALLQSDQAQDAVAVLQGARGHHPATSIGAVYRLLRELKQPGLADPQAQSHGRQRWRLCDPCVALPEPAPGNIRVMLGQMQRFLRELEQLGFAEAKTTQLITLATITAQPTSMAVDAAIDLLQQVAERVGYRPA